MREDIFQKVKYGCAGCTLDPQAEKNLEELKLYVYRWMLKISWVQRIIS